MDDDRVSPQPGRRIRQHSPSVHRHLKSLRSDMTPMERVLWDALRNRQLEGIKFRRQHPVNSFVLDFYAPEIKLAVELDGDVHDSADQQQRDQHRTARLAALGITVYRVRNMDVGLDLEAVLADIALVIHRLKFGDK